MGCINNTDDILPSSQNWLQIIRHVWLNVTRTYTHTRTSPSTASLSVPTHLPISLLQHYRHGPETSPRHPVCPSCTPSLSVGEYAKPGRCRAGHVKCSLSSVMRETYGGNEELFSSRRLHEVQPSICSIISPACLSQSVGRGHLRYRTIPLIRSITSTSEAP